MVIAITPEPSFDVPKGRYRATLKEVTHLANNRTKRGVENQVRLLFAVHVPRAVSKQYLVGKNYEASLVKGSELRKDLAQWRGRDLTEDEVALGAIDLKTLIGQEADLVIGHSNNAGFVKPYVYIKSIRQPNQSTTSSSLGG